MLRFMSMIIDTHAHLCDQGFNADLQQVLQKAKAAGLAAVIAVAENMDDALKNLELAARYRMIRAAAGLYPTVLDLDLASQMRDFIRTHRNRLAAIGEDAAALSAPAAAPPRNRFRSG